MLSRKYCLETECDLAAVPKQSHLQLHTLWYHMITVFVYNHVSTSSPSVLECRAYGTVAVLHHLTALGAPCVEQRACTGQQWPCVQPHTLYTHVLSCVHIVHCSIVMQERRLTMKLYDVLGAGLMMESVNVLSDHCQLPALRLQPRLQLSQSLRMYILCRGYI